MTGSVYEPTLQTLALRVFAWVVTASTFIFLINTYLTYWQGWPGVASLWSAGGFSPRGFAQLILWGGAFIAPVMFVARSPSRDLRTDAETLNAIVTYLIRACFWSVLFVGVADMIISFMRVEGFLKGALGDSLANNLGLSRFRGTYVHYPLIGLGFLLAAFTRTLGFTWLALLVVIAELQIVLSRFIFSYEQAFMGDLVRFWYAALFLFASAYTLREEGHVRVDVVYAGFKHETKGWVNAVGSVVLGLLFCSVVLYLGTASKSSIITAPLLAFETTQSGFGMYVKYLMAGFLGVFAVTMMIQFASYVLEGAADYRGDPGHRKKADDEDPLLTGH